jgi:predicted dehydrogenase
MNKIFNVGLVGCGHISETYFRAEEYFNNIKIIKCADINNNAAEKCAKEHGIKSTNIDDIFKDNDIEIILNLTIPKAHFEVSEKALLSGKHSYSEKPMCINFEDGKKLLALSKKKNLYLGSAPDTVLGAGIQKSKELIESGLIGKINLGNAIFAYPGVQSYHPSPEPWFSINEGGPVIDMGPYYITALVTLLGPVKSVTSNSKKVFLERKIGIGPRKGKKFNVECDTTYVSTLEFKNNSLIQMTLSFDVKDHKSNHIELYGDKGSIVVPDPNMFGGSVYTCLELGGEWKEHETHNLELGKINIENQSSRANESPTNANYRGAGLSEMAYSIENNENHMCNGDLSLHVLDIIKSIMKSAKTHKTELLSTECNIPNLFTQDKIKKLLNRTISTQ